MDILNAKIVSTELGFEDHGILTFFIQLDFGSYQQSFGGYALDGYDADKKTRVPSETAGAAIAGILGVLGVGTWEKLPGQYVRAQRRDQLVWKIGHPLEDKWFFIKSPEEAAAEKQAAEAKSAPAQKPAKAKKGKK